MVVSFSESLKGFGEHRGAGDPAHSRQGTQDCHVTMLIKFTLGAHLLQQGFDAPFQFLALLPEQAQPGQDEQDVFGSGFGGARRKPERGHVERFPDGCGVESTNAVRM